MSFILFRLIVPLIVFTLTAPRWCAGQDFSSYADGKRFRIVISSAQIAKAPEWKANEENPPLSARKATKLANALKERLVKDDDNYKWVLESVRLTPAEEGWFWMVVYESKKQRGGFSSGPKTDLRLAVLMDGTVPEPKVTKQ
jgi:hypothetical protein